MAVVIEERVEALERRIARLEREAGVVPAPPATPPPSPAPRVPAGAGTTVAAAAHRAATPPPQAALEDVLGGRVLAWAGGVALLAGLVLLFAIAVSRGWIGEGMRVMLAACASFALGALGLWLHEHRGRTEAALAATATAIAALFVTVAVATQAYDLVSPPVGTALALLVGAAATRLAIRWRAPGIGALGLLGGLLAPVLAGAGATTGSMALVWAAAVATTAVVLRQRWGWLTALALVVTTGQWAAWLAHVPSRGAGEVILVLVAFGALNAVAAVGYELRTRATKLRPSATALLAVNALVLAVAGRLAIDSAGHVGLANAWVVALAVTHLVAGVAALRRGRVPHDLAVLVIAIGVVLADAALALVLEGAPRAIAYAAGAVGFAAVARAVPANARDERVVGIALGTHVCLALIQALAGPAHPGAVLHGGPATLAAVAAVVALAAACFTAARLTAGRATTWRIALDATGLAALAYLAAVALDGPALALAWGGEAIALAAIARRTGDALARTGAVAFGALGAAHALVFEAPPAALVDGVAHPLGAVAALGAVAGAALALARAGEGRLRAAALAAASIAGLYLASVLLVDAFQPGHAAAGALAVEISVRQQGQVLLSALWALVGTTTVVVGLRRDLRPLRRAGLALLFAALGKVVAYDLRALTSVYRVGSCVVLGALLLAAAFAWQRLRPRPAPDLRTVPRALR